MALKVKNYELSDGTIFPEAYLRVQNVYLENKDYEYFKNSDKEDVEQELAWLTRIETRATVFVWSDELARRNRAMAAHWFNIEIGYDLSEHSNIIEQVYQKLNKMFLNSENV